MGKKYGHILGGEDPGGRCESVTARPFIAAITYENAVFDYR